MITVKIDPNSAKGKEALKYLKSLKAPESIHISTDTLSDEEMALPGEKIDSEELEIWLAREDGGAYSKEEVLERVKTSLRKLREASS